MPLSEYLSKTYQPDREYLDGVLSERNVGEWNHSRLQAVLLKYLMGLEDRLGILAVPEQRIQVRPNRFRIPDICVVSGPPGEQVLTKPPLLCIEILSPDDTMSALQEKIEEYLALGVANVWLFDPRRRKAHFADTTGIHEAANGVRETNAASHPTIRIEFQDL